MSESSHKKLVDAIDVIIDLISGDPSIEMAYEESDDLSTLSVYFYIDGIQTGSPITVQQNLEGELIHEQ